MFASEASNIVLPQANIVKKRQRTQMNEVALGANGVLCNEVMLRINSVALRANGNGEGERLHLYPQDTTMFASKASNIVLPEANIVKKRQRTQMNEVAL